MVVSVEVPKEAACCVPAIAWLLRLTVKVTEFDPGSGRGLLAVTVLGPGVDPKVRTVLAVAAAAFEPLVKLICGEKLSPGTLLVQLTVPHGAGLTAPNVLQLIDTAKEMLPFEALCPPPETTVI